MMAVPNLSDDFNTESIHQQLFKLIRIDQDKLITIFLDPWKFPASVLSDSGTKLFLED